MSNGLVSTIIIHLLDIADVETPHCSITVLCLEIANRVLLKCQLGSIGGGCLECWVQKNSRAKCRLSRKIKYCDWLTMSATDIGWGGALPHLPVCWPSVKVLRNFLKGDQTGWWHPRGFYCFLQQCSNDLLCPLLLENIFQIKANDWDYRYIFPFGSFIFMCICI